ncbi:hypothetical protein ACOMHN_032945 [Nucella lapillus]
MDPERISMASGGSRSFEMPGSDIRMSGYLKKMKTMKRKFFVLRSTSSSGPARLEYYDSEKKFSLGQPAKRSIRLHTCFNINRRSDSKHKHAIALYTKEDCFSVVCEDEPELDRWLGLMLEYQTEFLTEAERGRQHYDFVWQVTVQAKGLGQTMNMRGAYRLCLAWHSLYLFKPNMDKPRYVFQLETVRSVGHQDNVFKLVMGTFSTTGEGELYMQSDDTLVTTNIHETILDFMRERDKRENGYDSHRSFSESLHGSASSLSRPPPEFRHRSETFTPGSNRIRPRVERPMSVSTRAARSTSHIHNAVSPGSSPHVHGFMEVHSAEAHRLRSNSSDSKATRPCFSAIWDDPLHDHLSLRKMRPAVQEEPDWDCSLCLDDTCDLTSPGALQLDWDESDSQGGESYMEMNPGTSTPPLSTPTSKGGYMDMAPVALKGSEGVKEGVARPNAGCTYMAMTPATSARSCSAPIPIHPPHLDHGGGGGGYLDMTAHSVLPPVKEGGSSEGYVPMSPPYIAAASYPSTELKPDCVRCMLADDGTDFTQPPQRTYSLGSRPVKAITTTATAATATAVTPLASGYMDMTAAKKVSDSNVRSCSAPHLVHQPPHPHRGGRSGTVDSPTPTHTPSPSPLSASLKSDDSDAFMELDFYRPRTASDSYSYRPCGLGHRPRSASHGQGTRPLRRHKMMLGDCWSRLNHEALVRAHNTSQGSLDSLKVSSSESLKKLSQEVMTKTSQLNNNSGYMDMTRDKRLTPSPHPATPSPHPATPSPQTVSAASGSNPAEREGYVDMTLGRHEGYMDMSANNVRSQHSFRPFGDREKGGCGLRQLRFPRGCGEKGLPPAPGPPPPDTYMMYQPAVPPTHSGKENVPDCPPPNLKERPGSGKEGKKNVPDCPPPNLKERPGSGKEGKKRGGIFSLRGGDSGKHSSKKSESSQHSGSVPYAATGGQQFGSLGRDFRKKSKDLSKAARQKSSSFSKTFGISVSKPGKLLRKSPTPPSSLDGNDEYIEFTPAAAAKSDSDSSHSSGSFKMSRGRADAAPAQDEATYVVFEPGTIPASSSSQSQRVPSIPASGSYVPMGGGGGSQGKVFTVIKPTKKPGAKRSRSGEDSVQVQTSECGRNAECLGHTASPLACNHSVSRHPAPTSTPPTATPSPALPKSSLVKPLPVYPSPPVCHESGDPLTSDPRSQTVPSCVPAADSVSNRSESCAADRTAVSSSTPGSSGEGIHAGAQSSSSPSSSSLTSNPQSSSSSSSSHISSHQPSVASSLPSAHAGDRGYMHFDPAKPGVSVPVCGVVTPSLPEVVSAGVRSHTTTAPLGSGSTEDSAAASLSSHPEDYVPSVSSSSSPKVPNGADVPQCSSGSVRKTSGPDRNRRKSGDKKNTADKVCTGEVRTAAPSTETEGQTVCGSLVGGGGKGYGPIRLDGTTSGSTGGRGRGRHKSSGSVGIAQCTTAGKPSSSSTGGPDPGRALMNSNTNTRHSLTDLTTCQQPPFPSNALSQQQPSSLLTLSGGSGPLTSNPQKGLNYAKLDLSSADSLGDGGDGVRSPRNRSRHSSAAEEKVAPLSYATIDFEKSEGLRANANMGNKDVKLIL